MLKNSFIISCLIVTVLANAQIMLPAYQAIQYVPFDQHIAICDGTSPTEVVELISPVTGRVWMDRNIGASRAATNKNDIQGFGCLYQWGRGNDGHASTIWTQDGNGLITVAPVNGSTTVFSTTSSPGNNLFIISDPFTVNLGHWQTPITNSSLWQGEGSLNSPCPAGFRLPGRWEYQSEIDGMTGSDKGDDYFYSTLKLTTSAWRSRTGGYAPTNNFGGTRKYYWTSTVGPTSSSGLFTMVYVLTFSPQMLSQGGGQLNAAANIYEGWNTAYALNVRCIKN
jgi:uncharacterized protein (TIGR02145 family)